MKRFGMLCLVSFLLVFATGCSSGGSTSTGVTSQLIAQNQTGSTVLPPLSYYFPRARQHPDQELIKIINSASKTLDIAIYSLTKPDIVNAIATAKGRGVVVRLITDQQEADWLS